MKKLFGMIMMGNGEFNRSEDTLFHSNIDIEPLFLKIHPV